MGFHQYGERARLKVSCSCKSVLYALPEGLFILNVSSDMAIQNSNGTPDRGRLIGGIAIVILALVLVPLWMLRRGPVQVRAEKVVRQEIANLISTNGKIQPAANFEAPAAAPTTLKRALVKQ